LRKKRKKPRRRIRSRGRRSNEGYEREKDNGIKIIALKLAILNLNSFPCHRCSC
jgi:hypothetical protein